MLTITPQDLGNRAFYSYLTASVAPRPIALASTIDALGNVNLSPFSFFNIMGIEPPILVFAPNNRGRDGSVKDTVLNLREVPEVVINIVNYEMVEQMSLSSCEYPKGVNEFQKAGFTEEKSMMVSPPCVAESLVKFECKVLEIKQIGSMNLVICEVLMAHISETLLNEKGKIDQQKTDWVTRLGDDWYARISSETLFKVPKPNIHEGIGVDNIPVFVKESTLFTGNDLGRLGNIDKLPTKTEIANFLEQQTNMPISEKYLELAKHELISGNIKNAWCWILLKEK